MRGELKPHTEAYAVRLDTEISPEEGARFRADMRAASILACDAYARMRDLLKIEWPSPQRIKPGKRGRKKKEPRPDLFVEMTEELRAHLSDDPARAFSPTPLCRPRLRKNVFKQTKPTSEEAFAFFRHCCAQRLLIETDQRAPRSHHKLVRFTG